MNKARPYKFGIITANLGLVHTVKDITVDKNIDLSVSNKAMQESVQAAKEMESEGVEVILAGEATSSVLNDYIQIPIVNFSRSTFDFIRGLKEAVKFGSRILLPIFSISFKEVDILADLLKVKLNQFTYHNEEELRSELTKAAHAGEYDVVVGTGLPIMLARELGFDTVEAVRSEKDVEITINSAVSVVRSKRMEQEKSERYRCIIEAASDGIIVTDKEGTITTANRTAKQILTGDDEDVTGKSLSLYMSLESIFRVYNHSKPIYDSLENVKRKRVVCNHHPFMVNDEIVGCVSTLNEVSNVIRAENKIRRSLAKGHSARYSITDFLHSSNTVKDVISRVNQFSKTDSGILISGETGTGKEILSHAIHNLSQRKTKPFVSLNCAALPDQLLESELFGYEEGAFTGSRKGGKPGLFELAHTGTIFLDEIGETAENVQIRLLRVLQEREIMRLGADQLVPINVRVIAASHQDLIQEVKLGNFREDLFFRLNVLQIHIPPLRERLEDIPVLIRSFIADLSKSHNFTPLEIPVGCVEKLMTYSWPGNVRQLRNFVERLVLMSQSEFKTAVFDEIFTELIRYPAESHPTELSQAGINAFAAQQERPINQMKADFEIEKIKQALFETGYSKTKAAQKLGISRTTLWKRLKKANLAD